MQFAIFSDVHGNAPALDAALAQIGGEPFDATYCLGDLVGYGPFPNEVITTIKADQIPTIMGNYDDGVGFDRAECGCAYRDPEERRLGQLSFEWTKAHVTAENKAMLRGLHGELRFEADGKRVLLVHGSPRRMNEYLFEDRPVASLQRIAAGANADIIVFGHTHKPYVRVIDDVMFVNVGSVGKPKDGDWRACFAILDVAAPDPIRFVRVPYDRPVVSRAIRDSELPDEFALDLERDTPVAPAELGTHGKVEKGGPR